MNQLLATTVFGPEYQDTDFEVVSTPVLNANSIVDVMYGSTAGQRTKLLPPGGYMVKYVSGAFLLLDSNPVSFVVGGEKGASVLWKSNVTYLWSRIAFPIDDAKSEAIGFASLESTVDKLFCVEFTIPHRLQLVSPTKAVGSVKFKILRFKPKDII